MEYRRFFYRWAQTTAPGQPCTPCTPPRCCLAAKQMETALHLTLREVSDEQEQTETDKARGPRLLIRSAKRYKRSVLEQRRGRGHPVHDRYIIIFQSPERERPVNLSRQLRVSIQPDVHSPKAPLKVGRSLAIAAPLQKTHAFTVFLFILICFILYFLFLKYYISSGLDCIQVVVQVYRLPKGPRLQARSLHHTKAFADTLAPTCNPY